ncbi:MAG: hypothetical protein J3T61_03205 [Candidatus Brocadiales bacterium]|nr:hypothetical protein [Candidatus Bathyanammoxibius sp.]
MSKALMRELMGNAFNIIGPFLEEHDKAAAQHEVGAPCPCDKCGAAYVWGAQVKELLDNDPPQSINPPSKEGYLSPHFTEKEMGLTPVVRGSLLLVLSYKTLCQLIMEPIREHFGLPITITSGYRSPEHNKEVGGSKTSEHVATADWCACDFRLNAPLEEVFDWIRLESGLPFRQVILERPSFDQDPVVIHISWNRVRKGRQALEGLTGGRSRYFKREVL